MSSKRIEPRILKGFRDLLPEAAAVRNQMIRTLEDVFTTFGFVPIDTPALEFSEILLGKGSAETDKQLFRFTDQGGRDVALRFDLTVPLARYAAMHINELGTPFRRYHIAPVWRAEKPQRGRYREFIQCDFDIIGPRSALADAEVISVIHHALSKLAVHHQIRINNRLILNGLLAQLGKEETSGVVLRTVDKLEKLGEELVRQELQTEAGLTNEQIERVFSFLALSRAGATNSVLLTELEKFFTGNEVSLRGLTELRQVLTILSGAGMGEDVCRIDLSIARGLDYYTGCVVETTLIDLPEIGSICSGGRYDNLAQLYTSRELPGVGCSIGLDRILGAFEELGRLEAQAVDTQVFVAVLDQGTEAACMSIANTLRQAGFRTELAVEAGKLGNQLKYASKKGFRHVVIAGQRELQSDSCSIKDLLSGTQTDNISLTQLAAYFERQSHT